MSQNPHKNDRNHLKEKFRAIKMLGFTFGKSHVSCPNPSVKMKGCVFVVMVIDPDQKLACPNKFLHRFHTGYHVSVAN